MSLIQNPYASFLLDVEKPARYIGGEHFSVRKSWTSDRTKVALCFPEVYEIGMSHLGFKILYNELNSKDFLLAERSFAPWGDLEKLLRDKKLPLVSLESFRPLSEFDIVGFSLQFELTYPNILNMLDLGGIPLWSRDRTEKDPIVVAGGPCATHPEPLSPFVDLFWIGDAEELLPQISDFIGKARREGTSRLELLKQLSQWEGLYIPALYELEKDSVTEFMVPKVSKKIKKFTIVSLKEHPFPIESPIPHATAIFDKFSIEIARGCTEGCRFCQAGMIYRPVRERDPQSVISSVMEGLRVNGYQEASLTCLSTADYSAVTPLIIDLLDKMREEQSSLGIASLRAYGLDERVLDKMAQVKNSSFTFAPEAGTERLRRVINKNITEEDLLTTAHRIFSRGWQKMKLYFMIGLPTETDEDVEGIMETAKKTLQVGRRLGGKNLNLTVSASSFVPKPHTPFQWASMISFEEIERRQEILWQRAKEYRLNFRRHFSRSSIIEGVLARGDQRVAYALHEAFLQGARFDGWDEAFSYERWILALEKFGLKVDFFLRELPLEGRLPWSHIHVGVEEDLFVKEWKKALSERTSPPCGKVMGQMVHFNNVADSEKAHHDEKKKLVCYHCGVGCDLDKMVSERVEGLKSLKALTPVSYTAPEALAADPLKLRPKRGQVVGFRYRVSFAKVGPLTFISHLDLQKVLARIFKRSKLELLFSEGYNPKPLIAFGPALPLGLNSLCEFIDVRTPEPLQTDEISALLQQHSEKGLLFQKVEEIPHKTPSLQDSIISYDYFFPVVQGGDEVMLIEKLSLFEEAVKNNQAIHVSYQEKVRDIRPYLLSVAPFTLPIEQVGDGVLALLHEITPCSHRKGVLIKVQVTKGQTIKPIELFMALHAYGVGVERPIKYQTSFSI